MMPWLVVVAAKGPKRAYELLRLPAVKNALTLGPVPRANHSSVCLKRKNHRKKRSVGEASYASSIFEDT
jgi:hypothetical protein